MKQKRYDYIIAGAGCAGLSLAYYLSQSSLKNKSVLLIDKQLKVVNDRTWCFWEKGMNDFETIVCCKWPQVYFHGTDFSAALNLTPYQYKMIRSIDFYQCVQQAIAQQPNIEFLLGSISRISDSPDGAIVEVEGTNYHADYVFNSLYEVDRQDKKPGHHYLLQHFKGWEIETSAPFFDTSIATLMDFRVDQQRDTRFVYVLPLDAYRALVEYTVFSGSLLTIPEYDQQLTDYIRKFLRLDTYTIRHQEFGVIPMNDHPFCTYTGKHIVHIGTAGGQTKASTGYTFLRIQQQVKSIVQTLLASGKPYMHISTSNRFKLYDSMLLNIMAKNRYSGKDIFTKLFQKNPAGTILKFLDEDTQFNEELKIMSTTPYKPFILALGDILLHKKPIFS
jgi:lycopene beta-cyclase